MITLQRLAPRVLILFLAPTALALSAFANSYVPDSDDHYYHYEIGGKTADGQTISSRGEHKVSTRLPQYLGSLFSLGSSAPTYGQNPVVPDAFDLNTPRVSFRAFSIRSASRKMDAIIQRELGDSFFFAPRAYSNGNSGKSSSGRSDVKDVPTVVGAVDEVALNPTMSITITAPPDAASVNFPEVGSPYLPAAVAVSDRSPSTAVLMCYVLVGFALVGRRLFNLQLR